MNTQALADTEGTRAERSFELWRSWAREDALKAIEKGLRGQGGESDDKSRGLHSAFVLRFGWAWFVGAFAFGALIGLAGAR